jgi:ankyrin repeat protein
VNRLILAKQLIAHGANVKAASNSQGRTPLHDACCDSAVIIDFVEFLLLEGAVKCRISWEDTAHVYYIPVVSAAKFLLNWPTTDANITTRSGESFLAQVEAVGEFFSDEIAFQRTNIPAPAVSCNRRDR